MSNSLKKAGESITRQALKTPRAVSAKEAPFIEPAKESTTESMMPWKGFDQLRDYVKKQFGEERYKMFHRWVTFHPGDIHEMHQIPNPSTKVPISNDDPTMTAQFRHPSPGSQGPVRIPKHDLENRDDPFNVTYYTRDTGRRGADPANPHPELQRMKLELMDPNSPEVQEMKKAIEEPASSPGNQGRFATGPTDFDETGLRASMSANHASMESSLDANMPNHLPYPDWYDKQDEIVEWYKERDLPVPFGATGWGEVPTKGRIAKW